MDNKKDKTELKKVGHYFSFLKGAGRHQKRPRQNTVSSCTFEGGTVCEQVPVEMETDVGLQTVWESLQYLKGKNNFVR